MNLFNGGNSFLEQANTGKNSFWRYLLTLVLVTFLTIAAQTVTLLAAIGLTGSLDLGQMPETLVLAVIMLPFAFIIAGLWLGVHFIHRRGFKTLLTGQKRFGWKKLFLSAGVWLTLSILSDLLLSATHPGNVAWTFNARRFLPFLGAVLLLAPIQVSAEELLFRGYLTQAFGQLSRGVLIPLAYPALLFGLLHGFNPEVGAYGLPVMMAYYIGMGIFLGWVTLRDLGLELALGVHLATNLYALLVMTFPDSAIRSPALFTAQSFDPGAGLVVFAAMVIVYLLLILGAKGGLLMQVSGRQKTAEK